MLGKIAFLIKTQKKRYLQELRMAAYSDLLPERVLHDDVYIVSFPKSGVTWLSFLMANMHLKCSGVDAKATFFNTDSYIPDIHQSRKLKESILPFPGFRVIKSHSEHNPYYKKVIYLVRDPRAVMVSYYNFLTKDLKTFNGSMQEMLYSKQFGVDAWLRHVEGWFDNIESSQLINYLRYEDMKSDCKGVLDRIYTLMGYKVSDDIFEYAINSSSFSEMKKDENFYSEMNFTLDATERFMRKGETAGFRAELTASDLDYINERTEKWRRIFGYE